MKITKANGKVEYALIENLKKRAGETDEKIVDPRSLLLKRKSFLNILITRMKLLRRLLSTLRIIFMISISVRLSKAG